MRTDPGRFDRVMQHPEYGSAPEQPVMPADTVGIAAALGPMAVTTFGFVLFLIIITLIHEIEPPLAIALVFLGGAAMVLLGGVGMVARLVQFRNAPIHRFVAVIVKERTEVGGDSDARTRTTYFTTLQLRDGKRFELYTYRSLVGRIAVDDIGVAYMKSRTLVEFIRFDVD